MKLNQIKVKTFSAASADALTTAVQAFLDEGGEKVMVSVHYSIAAGPLHGAMICYST